VPLDGGAGQVDGNAETVRPHQPLPILPGAGENRLGGLLGGLQMRNLLIQEDKIEKEFYAMKIMDKPKLDESQLKVIKYSKYSK